MFDKEDVKLYDVLRMKALDVSFRLHGIVEYSEEFVKFFEDEELKSLVDDLKGIETNLLDEFRFKNLKTRNDIEQKSKQIQQKLIDRHKEQQEKAEKTGKWNFEDMVIPIEIHYKINVDPEITCAKYAGYIKRIKNDG